MAAALVVASLLSVSSTARRAPAATPPLSATAQTQAPVITATVDGAPILVKDVTRAVEIALQGRGGASADRAKLQAEVLGTLIDQKLVAARLEEMGWHTEEADIDQALADLETKLKPQNRSLADLRAQAGISEATMRGRLGWRLAWKKYLASYLTDQRLEAHFRAHSSNYDGGEIRVSHILLRPQRSGNGSSTAALLRRAIALRQQITAGKTDFAAAAKQYSSGPSRRQDGDLGFIPRHGLMVESFARAAFALKKKGDISAPVVTQFGVHLIRLTDVKAGQKKWTDVRQRLAQDLHLQLFQRLAQAQRGKAKIEMTGATPYFKPGTRQVVLPGSAARTKPQK